MQKPPYPSLYTKHTPQKVKQPISSIPLNTLTEELEVPTKPSDFYPHLTIYGTAPKTILKELTTKSLSFDVYEKGRNYVKLIVNDEKQLKYFMALNQTLINDEILGVFESSKNIDEKRCKKEMKKGIWRKIKEYFYG